MRKWFTSSQADFFTSDIHKLLEQSFYTVSWGMDALAIHSLTLNPAVLTTQITVCRD